MLSETSVAGAGAWVRLFEEQSSAITVDLPDDLGGTVPLMQALAYLQHPQPEVRATTAAAVTEGLAPGLRTRGFIYNTLMLDKSIDDRLRSYPTWISARNLANEASDESVQALVDAVVARYDIPQRWYRLKAQVLGVDKIADYDRMASVASERHRDRLGGGHRDRARRLWLVLRRTRRDRRTVHRRTLDRRTGPPGQAWWCVLRLHGPRPPPVRVAELDRAPPRRAHPRPRARPWRARLPRSRPGDLPSDDPVDARRDRVGVRRDGDQQPPAVDARRSGRALRVVGQHARGLDRHRLPAGRDEPLRTRLPHHQARPRASCPSTDSASCGPRPRRRCSATRSRSPRATAAGGATSRTSSAAPGYVYAYAYGQLLALSVYARYRAEGDGFVPAYLDLLRAGGSRSPEELAAIVGCDLGDPGFWDAGLAIVERQLDAAEEAARLAGRL